jgi:carbon storage regulator CsrA
MAGVVAKIARSLESWLCLSRRVGEDVIIQLGGEVVVVRVIELRSGKARLGFHAPKHVKIDRREIFEKKDAEQCHGT